MGAGGEVGGKGLAGAGWVRLGAVVHGGYSDPASSQRKALGKNAEVAGGISERKGGGGGTEG